MEAWATMANKISYKLSQAYHFDKDQNEIIETRSIKRLITEITK